MDIVKNIQVSLMDDDVMGYRDIKRKQAYRVWWKDNKDELIKACKELGCLDLFQFASNAYRDSKWHR
jgi:hypothetical protein